MVQSFKQELIDKDGFKIFVGDERQVIFLMDIASNYNNGILHPFIIRLRHHFHKKLPKSLVMAKILRMNII